VKVSFTKELSLNFTVKRCGEADLNAYKRSLNWQPFMKRVYSLHEVTKNTKTTKEISTPSKFNNVKAMLTISYLYLCAVHWEP